MKNRMRTVSKLSRKAFTLIEMLVVLLIVSVLIGVGAQVMKNATTAQGVESAVPIADSIFAQARGLAKGSGYGARVVIYKGGNSGDMKDKHLRYMGIVRQVVDDKGTADPSDDDVDWNDKLIARGTLLPAKTFFNESLSDGFDTMQVQIPGAVGEQECFYYEFNSEGILVVSGTPASDEPHGIFIVQAGRLLPNEDTPRELSSDNREAGGFAIWKRGNTSLFRSVNEIPSVGSGTNPTF